MRAALAELRAACPHPWKARSKLRGVLCRRPHFPLLVTFPAMVSVARVWIGGQLWSGVYVRNARRRRSNSDATCKNQNPMSLLIPSTVRDTQPPGGADGEESVPFVCFSGSVEARLPDGVAPSTGALCGAS